MLWTLASGGTEGGKRAKMTTIGMETIRLMGSQVEALLLDYMTEIDKAYLVMGDDPLSVGMTIKVSPSSGGVKVETAMNFVTGRIKDKISGSITEKQLNMFQPNPAPKLNRRTYHPPPCVGRTRWGCPKG